MYEQYFHFAELPFSIAPDPHFIYMSRRHQEGLAHLLYGITVGGGFVALTGEVGTGKTTLCHCLLGELPDTIDIALILNPKLNAIELLAAICDELGVAYDKGRQTLKQLVDALNHYLLEAHAIGRRTVLLIDEAQNLSMEVLEQVRLLTNLETSKTKLLQIILVGQPELKQMLRRQELRQLNQRITARYHLQPLSYTETRDYIRHRLRVCGGDPDLFKERAIRKIYKLSGGIPRVINILCDRALLGAYAENAAHVTPGMVKNAAQEALAPAEPKWPAWGLALLGMLALGGVAAGRYYLFPDLDAAFRHRFLGRQSETAEATSGPTAPKSVSTAPALAPKTEPLPPRPVSFAEWVTDIRLTLPLGFANALSALGKTASPGGTTDCEAVKSFGVLCQLGKASWKELLAMNRPVILEFVLPTDEKRYALLTGLKQGNPVLLGSDRHDFSLAEVLSYWNGYYLLLWTSTIADARTIFPEERSERIVWLRQQMALFDGLNPTVAAPQLFDQDLKNRVLKFQHRHHLTEDGVVGVQTLFYLDNLTEAPNTPHLTLTD
ncbi:ExeA family protein [Methylomicrobium sp. RS1]|uniref:ExeA family protein n=1 Tax=Candidatus Methylomicrobium oryzae TaxID=2802053 RepID=UPI001922C836|nr:ExeA family protein [Methylomicrobium sp. RS1]MBL1265887.1 AAA family ATPase [Methylomicrobium sp. RS1]